MSRELTTTEFYQAIVDNLPAGSDKRKITAKMVQKIWESMVSLTMKELYQFEQVRLPFIGTLKMIDLGGREIYVPYSEQDKKRLHTDVSGRKIYVDKAYRISMKISETYTEVINGNMPSTIEAKRNAEALAKQLERQRVEEARIKRREEAKAEKERLEKEKTEALLAAEKKRNDKIAEFRRRRLETVNEEDIAKTQEEKATYGY